MNIDKLIKHEFSQENGLIYLNHAAVAPWPRRTAEAVHEFADENVRLGATNYQQWVKKESSLREQLRDFVNAASVDEVSLLKNTSEALSVVACGIKWKNGENIVSTDQEFPSNRIPWQAQQKHGVEFRGVDIASAKDPELALMDACDRNTRVLAISSVQYGTGIRLDMPRLGQFCRDNGILFCVDAIQSIGAHRFDVQEIQADFAMADAHKWMLGPEGIALFYCHQDLREQLELHEYGWHMVEDCKNYDARTWEPAVNGRRFECGSPNMLGIHALSASLTLFQDIGMDTVESLLLERTDYLTEQLSKFDKIRLLSPQQQQRRAGIVTFTIDGVDMATFHQQLLGQKIICAQRMGGIRFSPHFYTDHARIDKVLEVINIIY